MNPIEPFQLERYFAKYEFDVEYLLSASDVEPLTQSGLLTYADEPTRALWDDLWLGYTESKGHPALLDEIASLYDGITAQNVIEVVPEEGIFIAMNTLLQSGDHIVVSYPAYQSLYAIAESLGCHVTHWHANDAGHFDPTTLADLVQPDTRMIVVNFPHNPTGVTLTSSQFEQVVAVASTHGCMLFSDEMYRWSEQSPSDRLPAACEVYERGISLCGLSKTFALPGLRVGWLATQDKDVMQQFVTFKDYTTICGSAPSEVLALVALRAKDALIQRTLAIVATNLTATDAFISQYTDLLHWKHPHVGTLTQVHLAPRYNVDTLAANLVQQQATMIVPASQFGMDGNWFRLGLGRRSLPQGLERFGSFLDSLD